MEGIYYDKRCVQSKIRPEAMCQSLQEQRFASDKHKWNVGYHEKGRTTNWLRHWELSKYIYWEYHCMSISKSDTNRKRSGVKDVIAKGETWSWRERRDRGVKDVIPEWRSDRREKVMIAELRYDRGVKNGIVEKRWSWSERRDHGVKNGIAKMWSRNEDVIVEWKTWSRSKRCYRGGKDVI